jgi:hypothetical protein
VLRDMRGIEEGRDCEPAALRAASRLFLGLRVLFATRRLEPVERVTIRHDQQRSASGQCRLGGEAVSVVDTESSHGVA